MKYLCFLLSFFVCICCTEIKKASEKKSQSEEITADLTSKDSEWIYLFDGTTLDGWRNYNSETLSPQWVIVDGEMTFDTEKRTEEERKGGNDIIYAAKEFKNFELYLEWKIPEGGNSGILYHIKEGYGGPPEVSPEYQLLDDLKWEEINNAKLEDWQKTGADYAMYAPDESRKKVKPAGEWNSSRIKFTDEKVEYFLNGEKTVEFVHWSDDWKERKSKGKWKDYPDYGKFKSGYIGLQDHDSPLWFREIKVREL